LDSRELSVIGRELLICPVSQAQRPVKKTS
jgi:hypothetical protein